MPVPATVERIARPLVREQVYATIRDWIVCGTLRPDEKVRDVELALRLGVSRTPVREALQRLQDEGLVLTARNRWTRVSPLRLEDARTFYPIVWALEGLAVHLCGADLTPADLAEMKALNRRLARALRAGDPVAASAADNQFHGVFLSRTQNPELTRMVQDLKLKLRRIEIAYFRGSIVARRSVVEHRRIVAALEARDVRTAAAAIEANWRSALGRLLAAGQSCAGGRGWPAPRRDGSAG